MTGQIRFHSAPYPGLDAMRASTAHVFPRHTHDQYGIGVIDRGGHASWSDRGQVEAGPGSVICVNPGEVHDGSPIGATRTWRMLYLEPALMRALRADVTCGAHAHTAYFGEPAFSSEPLRALFNRAFASATSTAGTSCDAMACESALLLLIAHVRMNCPAPGTQRASAPTRRARERIDADPCATHTLTQLAADVGLNRYQLLRAFARDLGLTPHAYILQRRLALARRLIRAGQRPVDVAAITGFFDQSHFHRYFVRQFAVSPQRYAHPMSID
jgi:AraC-like DNA-binding protein